ncbi:MAG: VCBS repeat-containing protein, partial [Acidobacteria bacterium]|nr:VCBS repeat-containing protein [Acidobacteriota bacterium]
VNRDGLLDLAVTNFNSGSVTLLLGDGAGGIASQTNFFVGNGPRSIVVTDFNRDGKPDLAVALAGENRVAIYLGL